MNENDNFSLDDLVRGTFSDAALILKEQGHLLVGEHPTTGLRVQGSLLDSSRKLLVFWVEYGRRYPQLHVRSRTTWDEQTIVWTCLPLDPPHALEDLKDFGPWPAKDWTILEEGGFSWTLPRVPPGEGDRQAFNWEKVLQSFEDGEMARQIMESFIIRSQEITEQLKTAFANKNAFELRRLAHSLKGTARMVHAVPASMEALELENAAREERWSDAPPLMESLELRLLEVRDLYETMKEA